jgi:hypothetical protein
MSQLMSAVVGVLNENLVESIMGFYKLRKAYITLDGILEAESKYMQSRYGAGLANTRRNSSSSLNSTRSERPVRTMPGQFAIDAPKTAPLLSSFPQDTKEMMAEQNAIESDESDVVDSFEDADEDHNGPTAEIYLGTVEFEGVVGKLEDIPPKTAPVTSSPPRLILHTPTEGGQPLLDCDPGSDVFANPVDVFVHSGANLCFGILILLISLIPPAFSKLLLIIGFRGDRDRGLRMLWQASKFHNINGAMAGLVILGHYNAFVGYCDVLPDVPADSDPNDPSNVEGYPTARLQNLLADMRTRFPRSHLWLLEESRMQSSNRRLDSAIALLSTDTQSPLKQVEAMSMFEKALKAMYAHRFELCSESFIKCCELNNWSHALYYYIAGACSIELYRRAKDANDSTAATAHAAKATELLYHVRMHAGKKRFMARQLPFDTFVARKLNKWEGRARDWGVPLIDAVGVSPLEEMNYFWNGHKRMDDAQLATSLDLLAFSDDAARNPHWAREALDERAILAVLRAAVLRCLRRFEEAKTLVRREVVGHDRALFKGGFKDDWTCVTAHYEIGACLWFQRMPLGKEHNGQRPDERLGTAGEGAAAQGRGGEGEAAVLGQADPLERNRALVREAEGWVEKAARWEGYQLDIRIGMKVATALDTLKKWRALHDA